MFYNDNELFVLPVQFWTSNSVLFRFKSYINSEIQKTDKDEQHSKQNEVSWNFHLLNNMIVHQTTKPQLKPNHIINVMKD